MVDVRQPYSGVDGEAAQETRSPKPLSFPRCPGDQGTSECASSPPSAPLRRGTALCGCLRRARARWRCHRADPQRQRHRRLLVCSRCTSGKSVWPGRDVRPHRTPAAGGPRPPRAHTLAHRGSVPIRESVPSAPRSWQPRARSRGGVDGRGGDRLWLTILPEGYQGPSSPPSWERMEQGINPHPGQDLEARTSPISFHTAWRICSTGPLSRLCPESPQGGWEVGQPPVPGLELADQPGRVCSPKRGRALPTHLPCTRRQGPPVFSTVTSPTVSRAKGKALLVPVSPREGTEPQRGTGTPPRAQGSGW